MEKYKAKHPIRFVTAASLFDGHDAAINLIRRLLQDSGAEVIHLGHNRSVREIVDAAVQEDVQGIAISSYQGGHVEFFKYLISLLKARGADHIRVFGGGGGVIIPSEIELIQSFGVVKIFSPDDGRRMGLQGMINFMLQKCDFSTAQYPVDVEKFKQREAGQIARAISYVENGIPLPFNYQRHPEYPVIGITGTGGAGKSSLTDEWVRRLRMDLPDLPIAILSVDPTRRKTGGALLGDRIRMNAIDHPNTYMRSLATRGSHTELSDAVTEAIAILQEAGFPLIIVETSGIGQGDAAIAEVADRTIYTMTSEFGAATQLEKIDMLDFAHWVVINKFEKRGSLDALHAVRKQWRRNHGLDYTVPDQKLPIFGTMASQFNDQGVNAFYHAVIDNLKADFEHFARFFQGKSSKVPRPSSVVSEIHQTIIPPHRHRYLSEIAETVRAYHRKTLKMAKIASKLYQLQGVLDFDPNQSEKEWLLEEIQKTEALLDPEAKALLQAWPSIQEQYKGQTLTYQVRNRTIVQSLTTQTLSGLDLPKIALPNYWDLGRLLIWLRKEHLPGYFPFTAGVFPFKRSDEDPKRQFAGEGTPERTNRRFHYLTQNDPARRLSTAFDSPTLYGADPEERPDVFGKIGESGVSVCTLDDMKRLYKGFRLTDPNTSVSMTINGPAPIMLAMYLNTAIDQEVEHFENTRGRKPTPQEREEIQAQTLSKVRGTVQADILKEDQAQNTCIFSTEFALRMMGDMQDFLIQHQMRNYYSVSISGYHIAEAGANPITQLAFTLANGFTYVEYYLARGMHIDDFARNLSFFFSNGLDAEYSVLGRVARRIWAIALKNRYGANLRSQKLKYHIQTSGRSLHAQEVDFNDIRTTLQALLALEDNCNSLHTNAYDEAVTTPTEESVRRAMAIQLIATKEFGRLKNENPLQGTFIIEWLTDEVERAVLEEFDRLTERGGVLGAMERQYQRNKIQDESMHYEILKHSGELPIIGVNTYLNPHRKDQTLEVQNLARASLEEKQTQLEHLKAFQQSHASKAEQALERLRQVALEGGNIFQELLYTVRYASLGQITQTLYEVGGQYRRAI